jgi:hypothetical protein
METKEIGESHPWRLVGIGSFILVFLVQILAFVQGFYIAIARLDYHQSMVMLRPTFLYATPFYFLMGYGIARREPRRYLFYPLMVTPVSILVNSLFYYYLYHIPLAYYVIDPSVLLGYFFVTFIGAVIGNKTRYHKTE